MQKVEYSITKNEATKEWVLWKSVTNFQKENGDGLPVRRKRVWTK